MTIHKLNCRIFEIYRRVVTWPIERGGPAGRIGYLLVYGLLAISCAFGLNSAAFAEEGIQDAVGVPDANGAMRIYSDPFCAGYAETFKARAGDKALIPECPEEPVEPLSMPPYEKGNRAGEAAAQSFIRFRKQSQNRPSGQAFLSGFYDASQDRWVTDAPSIPPSDPFQSRQLAMIIKDDDKMGAIDKTGKIIIPFDYQQVDVDRSDTFMTVHDPAGKVGVYDRHGALIIPVKYDDVQALDSTHFRASSDGIFHVMDLRGNLLFATEKEITSAGEGMFWFMEKPQRFGILNDKGTVIIPAEFIYTSQFRHGRLVSQQADGENYVVYRDGRVVREH